MTLGDDSQFANLDDLERAIIKRRPYTADIAGAANARRWVEILTTH